MARYLPSSLIDWIVARIQYSEIVALMALRAVGCALLGADEQAHQNVRSFVLQNMFAHANFT